MSDFEFDGYLDVKLPLKERKFNCWRVWQRQWCCMNKNGDDTISIKIGCEKNGDANFSISIPQDVFICRTKSRSKFYAFGVFRMNKKRRDEAYLYMCGDSETETQKWIANIRRSLKCRTYSPVENEFDISLIDNTHSKEAGLTGLYGYLSITPSEIIIKDPSTGKIKVTWHWSQISHSYLPLPANSQDVHRICVVRTSSKFKSGEGELELYCPEADKLHVKLSACPRFASVPRIVTQPLPRIPDDSVMSSSSSSSSSSRSLANDELIDVPPPASLFNSRRMSRSLNDLQTDFIRHLSNANNLPRQRSAYEMILLPQNNAPSMRKAHSFIFANVGFLISTPGCSVANSLTDVSLCENNRGATAGRNETCSSTTTNETNYPQVEYETIGGGVEEERRNDIDSWVASTKQYDRRNHHKRTSNDNCRSSEIPPPLPPRSHPNFRSREKNTDCTINNATQSLPSPEYLLTRLNKSRTDRKYSPSTVVKDKIQITEPIPI